MNCTRVRENLNRFLDNDLAAKEATECASHLETCVGCRHAYEQLRYPVSLAFFAVAGGVAGVLLLLMIQESPIQNSLRPITPSTAQVQPR